MPCLVSSPPAADSVTALVHFEAMLRHETDCWDVHESLRSSDAQFILLDVRGPTAFAAGHIAGAVNLHHREIDAERMNAWPAHTLFVVYCAGPHCNGANRAAIRLASLGRPAKMMIGGLTGWVDEGFRLEKTTA